jgi:hypothetical protein
MQNSIKNILRLFMPRKIRKLRKKFLGWILIKQWRKKGYSVTVSINEWQQNGCPIPPPHEVKQITIKEYQKLSGFTTFVETGTYLGEMVDAQIKNFRNIISVELGMELFKKAQVKYANENSVTIIQGDSGEELPKIVHNLKDSAIFWLDGHYSSGITAKGERECPIFEELDAILTKSKYKHIILIDDARCFIGAGDYPSIEKLSEYIRRKNNKYNIEIKHDIIRCVI